MNKSITLHVTGKPRAQPRGRFVHGSVVSTTGHAKGWKELIVAEARRASVAYMCGDDIMQDNWINGTLRIDIDWYFETDKKELWNTAHPQKPDRDNLDKLVLDAITKSGLIKDDKQAAQGMLAKWWAPHAGVVITITPALNMEEWEKIKHPLIAVDFDPDTYFRL